MPNINAIGLNTWFPAQDYPQTHELSGEDSELDELLDEDVPPPLLLIRETSADYAYHDEDNIEN